MAASLFQLKRKKLALLSGLAIFLAVLFLPTPEGMTPVAQKMSAVALLMAVWWMGEATSISATALLPLVLFPLLGIMSARETAPNYANHLIFLFLGGFMIALAMERWNFHKRLALNIISRAGDSVPRMILGFMVATAFLSMWISNTATTMMMLPVAMAVVRQIAAQSAPEGSENESARAEFTQNLGLVFMLGLAYSASIGGVGTLIGTPPNIVLAGFYKELFPDRPEITFFQWMLVAIPIVVIFLPLAWVYLCRVVSPLRLGEIQIGSGGGEAIQNELRGLGRMSRAEKYIAGIFSATAALWIFRQPINLGFFAVPGWSQIFARPEYLQDSTVAMAMGLLLMILPVNGNKGIRREDKTEYFLLNWKTVETGVPWGILILFGGGFSLAAGFKTTGLDQWIGLQLSGVADWPLWLMILIVCLGITFLTELTSNTATATMILPILGGVAVGAGYPPLLIMAPAALSASFAFMLPVATPPNAIVFGSGWVTVPQMARAGLVLNFLGAILITLLVLLLAGKAFA